MGRTRKRYYDVIGAPVSIGDKVRVFRLVDNTENASLIGQVGVVTYLEYDCGCGQRFPDDPMIGVRFESGYESEFWQEELEVTGTSEPRPLTAGRIRHLVALLQTARLSLQPCLGYEVLRDIERALQPMADKEGEECVGK